MTDVCDVAIIGGGPAGLAAAIELKRRGVQSVVVLERDGETGGVPRHCGHPPFGFWEFGRLLTGPQYAAKLTATARSAGVEIRLNHTVTRLGTGGHLSLTSPKGVSELQACRVILATGARETPRSARLISGVRPVGVINTGALQAYVHLNGLIPFRRPVVVGTELVSLSSLATCRSHGMQPVAMLEEGPRPVARWPLTLFPTLVGVPLHLNTRVVEILGRGRVEAIRIADGQGRERTLECDGVLLTGRFTPEASLVRSSALEFDTASNGPVIDQDGRCSDPAYFAAGNMLRPIETSGWCFREGRRLGAVVAQDLAAPASAILRRIPVRHGEGLKFVLPQIISLRSAAEPLPRLQLRADRPLKGRLEVSADGALVTSQTINTRPERRILVSSPEARVKDTAGVVKVEVRS